MKQRTMNIITLIMATLGVGLGCTGLAIAVSSNKNNKDNIEISSSYILSGCFSGNVSAARNENFVNLVINCNWIGSASEDPGQSFCILNEVYRPKQSRNFEYFSYSQTSGWHESTLVLGIDGTLRVSVSYGVAFPAIANVSLSYNL